MDVVFSRYLDPAFRHVSCQGPARVRSRDDALRGGLSCPALAHLVIRDLAHFEPVPDPERMRAGDLVWLGVDRPRVQLEEFVPRYDGGELANAGDFPVKHAAICAGTRDDGDHLLLHASSAEGTNALWPLRRFADCDRYRRIYAIRRLRGEFRHSAGTSGGAL